MSVETVEQRAGGGWFPARSRSDGGRIVELDALRGLASLTVVLYHYTHRYDQLFGHVDAWARWDGWRLLRPLGVPMFFIISGFVIPMTMDAAFSRARAWQGDQIAQAASLTRWRRVALPAVRAFVAARIARLYPAFVVASLLIWLVMQAAEVPGRMVAIEAMWAHFTFAPRLIGYPYADPVFWTLQNELVFYALVAVVALLGLRRHLGLVLAALAGLDVVGIGFAGRWHMFLIGLVLHEAWRRWKTGAAAGGFTWWHGLLLGVAAARVLIDTDDHGVLRVLPARLWGEPVVLAAAAVLIAGLTRRRIAVLEWRGLAGLGTISYCLYLVHQNIGYAVMLEVEGGRKEGGAGLGLPSLAGVAAAMAVALTLALILAYAVERPIERVLRPRLAGPAGHKRTTVG